MSRLIVKNLPNKVTADTLREIFGQKGEVTDVQLKFTKDGKFRNFGFIGYRTEEQATAARNYFDGTCIRSMKIQVEPCANLGDETKPRAWSKYASDSTAYKKLHKDEIEEKTKQKKQRKLEKNKDKIKTLLKKHKHDPLFTEFIEAHVNDQTTWIKDILKKTAESSDDDSDEETNKQESAEVTTGEHGNKQEETEGKKILVNTDDKEKVANTQISDLQYMKLLMKKVNSSVIHETTQNNNSDENKKVRNRPLFYVKITGLPFKCKKKNIKEFFRPLVPFSIRLPHGKGKKITGFCYVGFRTEKELKKALNKDKLFIGNHRLHIHKYENKAAQAANEEQEAIKKRNEQRENNEESIGESGSIFVRNLPYVVSEEELTSLFEKYGPLAEVNMPVDPILRQPKGFATVTFVMPEHAAKAYAALDGTAFCGRMLHLLPAKADKTQDDSDDEGLTFKEKKAKKQKAQAKSSHNWNTLFLGANAVADVVAAAYDTTKERLLTEDNKGTSAAVRLALGETQLVSETRTFLENNGVYLDAFNKPPKRRSKTCILVKNLPANTDKDEVKVLFEKHGHVARFLMPRHGITALVDFVEPYEARKAFSKLAYSPFKAAPLYLEWAPENVFVKFQEADSNENAEQNREENGDHSEPRDHKRNLESSEANKVLETEHSKEENEEDNAITETEEPENDTTIFVKNLNFKTTEENLKTHFSCCGKLHSVTVAKKKDTKNPGQLLSMGYGFVRYYRKQHANEALKLLQNSTLHDKQLELKRSDRGNTNAVQTSTKSNKNAVQNGTKILVRNVPFQAQKSELHEIFRAFGEIKTLRLPKKLSPGSEQHRGFAFVDYYSKADAKSAFKALGQSTHLYGRRLVLEWADQTDENENIDLLRKRTAQTFNAKTPGGKKSMKGAVDVDAFVDDGGKE